MFSNRDIERYYDLSEAHYKRLWQLEKSRSLHYGYWDEHTGNFHEALLNTNKVLAEKAMICAGDKVLDAGCGIGGSSLWLAQNLDCKVTGITLSSRQVSMANAIAFKEGLADKVHFEKKDYCVTGYPDASFDVIWAVESICHATDKAVFLREAYRLLKKGGRLILFDYFKQDKLGASDNKLLQRWLHGWAIKDIAVLEHFKDAMFKAGFVSIETENATNSIRRSAQRMYRFYFPGAFLGYIYRLFHRKASIMGKRNVDTAYLQYKCLQKKLWQYHIVLGIKP